jgi:hypothetical protein
MKKSILFYAFILLLIGCKNETQEINQNEAAISTNDSYTLSEDSAEVLSVVKKVMTWTDSKDQIGILPLKGNDSNICVGVDFELQSQNTRKLAKTNYFTNNFILNYDRIIHRFNDMIKGNEVEKFDIAEMAPFSFATDASPWCNCQDNFGWDKIVLKEIKFGINTCDIKWGWIEWENYSYEVKLIKENGVWKIDQMEGFDYSKATKI